MLWSLRQVPKWAGMMPRTSRLGESSACTMAYWSSPSFLASVLMMARRCVATCEVPVRLHIYSILHILSP